MIVIIVTGTTFTAVSNKLTYQLIIIIIIERSVVNTHQIKPQNKITSS